MPEPNVPIMQDLDDPKSFISQAFKRLSPPRKPFDPNGAWTHRYHDISSLRPTWRIGEVTLQHQPNGELHIESSRNCPDGYRYFTDATMQCAETDWRPPLSWRVHSKTAKTAGAAAHLNSGLRKQARVANGRLSIKEGTRIRKEPLPGPYNCKWSLLDGVGRLPGLGRDSVSFTLIDEYDELCPEQTITFAGKKKVKSRAGVIEVSCYQHTGRATMPGVYYVDTVGRVLFYLAGMQLLALADASGETTGYLK
jgi:hypothetical protein